MLLFLPFHFMFLVLTTNEVEFFPCPLLILGYTRIFKFQISSQGLGDDVFIKIVGAFFKNSYIPVKVFEEPKSY